MLYNLFDDDKSYLGKDIADILSNNLDKIECRILYTKYINPIKEEYKRINDKVYYKISKNESNNIIFIRDIDLSSRSINLNNLNILNILNKNKSILGKDIISICNEEIKTTKDNLFKLFYDTCICSNKYYPKDNIYYFMKYNTSGKYYILRDLVKSPKRKL